MSTALSRAVRSVCAMLLTLLLSALLLGCAQEAVTLTQFDYLTSDMTLYAAFSPDDLRDLTFTVPARCRYTDSTLTDFLAQLFNAYPKTVYLTDRAVRASDTVCMYYTAKQGGEVLFSLTSADGDAAELALSGGDFMGLSGFNAHLIGSTPGTCLTFSLTVAEDHAIAALAGKTLTFEIEVVSVREEQIPTALTADYILDTLGWQTELTESDEVVAAFRHELEEELQEAAEEDLRHALEDEALAYLCSVYTPTALPAQDLLYNLQALTNYYEAARLTENSILSLWADTNDGCGELGSYLARTYSLSTPLEGFAYLVSEAQSLTQENLTVAAAFHALALTISEQELATLTEALAELDSTVLSDPAYVRNLCLYEKLMDALLAPANCTVLYAD